MANITSRAYGKTSTTKSHAKQSNKKDSLVQSKKDKKKPIHYSVTKLPLHKRKVKNTEESVLMRTDKFLKKKNNPSCLMNATVGNPFINDHVFYNEQWFDEREKKFVKWLNVLLTPPEQLSSSNEMPKVDGAELWKKCCKSDVAPAPSNEIVSSLHLVNHRLDSLHRKACAMLRIPVVADVLSKVTVQIEKGILSFRKDRNIRDIGLKRTALDLLLCYNPLWLRIGLETILGRTIPVESNSDIVGIVSFIAQNILSDPYLTQRYAIPGVKNLFKPGYEEAIKKHILKKIFLLVFFLDYAKDNKLIFHNPCLFCKDAQYKESRELLLAIAREFLSGIGDVTKHLKTSGYVVKHKQTYLNEYNYAVTHLESDLRDGVRLVKVTEIILQDPSLCLSLRVPAISKLQKIHNVKIALTALTKAGNIVEGEITAKDIVEGHKEKTMSLLWQIINQFQVSRFTAAANKIQKWYRSLHIYISRKIQIKKQLAKQSEMEDKASVVIQKYWRRYITCEKYKLLKRQNNDKKLHVAAIVTIQRWLKATVLMQKQRKLYQNLQNAAILIQCRFRAIKLMKEQRKLYLEQRCAAILIQRKYRAMKELVLRKETAVRKIQWWYRCSLLMKKQRAQYLQLRSSVVKIQCRFRALKLMKEQRQLYLQQRCAAVLIQKKYRAMLLDRKQRTAGKGILAAKKIQACWRGYKARMKFKASKLCCNIKPPNTYTLNEEFSLRSLYYRGVRSFTSSGMYSTVPEGGVRLSPELCEEFLLSPHLDTLLLILKTVNRSKPSERLLLILLKILINILRHPSGIQVILMKKDMIPLMLTLTNTWCAKKNEVLFCYFCTAWWLIGVNPQAVQDIRNTCDTSKILVKCYTKVKTWNTPCKSGTKQRNLPTILPSWSLSKSDDPNFFLNANFAISQVLNKLNIEYVK